MRGKVDVTPRLWALEMDLSSEQNPLVGELTGPMSWVPYQPQGMSQPR